MARRARIVLACSMGLSYQTITAELEETPAPAGKWRRRFVEQRLDGGFDEPRSGSPCTIAADHRKTSPFAVLDMTCGKFIGSLCRGHRPVDSEKLLVRIDQEMLAVLPRYCGQVIERLDDNPATADLGGHLTGVPPQTDKLGWLSPSACPAPSTRPAFAPPGCRRNMASE